MTAFDPTSAQEGDVRVAHGDMLEGSQFLPWYALRVRSNYDQTTALHLRQRGYEEFAPSYRQERQWSDRKKVVDAPLFPGYVFCRLDYNDRLPVLSSPGVVSLVSFGKEPCPVAEEEIQAIRRMVVSGLPVVPWPFLQEGQPVLLERGPLAGVRGVLAEMKNGLRVVVSISLLQRSVSVEVDASWIRPLQASDGLTRLTNGPWVSLEP